MQLVGLLMRISELCNNGDTVGPGSPAPAHQQRRRWQKYGCSPCIGEMMRSNLEGLNALVTGASSGIGAATAKALAAQGVNVALTGRREGRLQQLLGSRELQGVSALALPADLTDKGLAERVVERAAEAFGGLDIVINNAGVLRTGPVESAAIEDFEHLIDVNLRAFLYIARLSLPHLLRTAESSERRVADLVNVASVSGRRSVAGSAVYNMTKWGVVGFSESLRAEVTTRDVRVSLVEPGVVRTELASHLPDEAKENPVPAFSGFAGLEAQDVADAICYIVSRPRHVAINELLLRPTGQVV